MEVVTPTPESAVSIPQPAVEAFAAAIAITTHQHSGDGVGPEEAPQPVQAQLPIPRPPFNYRSALVQIASREVDVEQLAKDVERTKKEYTRARGQWEDAAKELARLIRQVTREMRDSESGDQHELRLEGQCAWEKAHPGETCRICAEERERVRANAVADALAGDVEDVPTDDTPIADAPGVVIRATNTVGHEQYLVDVEDGFSWTSDRFAAEVFTDEAEAWAYINDKGLTAVDVISAAITPDPEAFPTCTSTLPLAADDPKGVPFLECGLQQGHEGPHSSTFDDAQRPVTWTEAPPVEEPPAEPEGV